MNTSYPLSIRPLTPPSQPVANPPINTAPHKQKPTSQGFPQGFQPLSGFQITMSPNPLPVSNPEPTKKQKKPTALTPEEKDLAKDMRKFMGKFTTAKITDILDKLPPKQGPLNSVKLSSIEKAIEANMARYSRKANDFFGTRAQHPDFMAYLKENLNARVINRLAKDDSIQIVYDKPSEPETTPKPTNLLRNLYRRNESQFAKNKHIQFVDTKGHVISYTQIIAERLETTTNPRFAKQLTDPETKSTTDDVLGYRSRPFNGTSNEQVITDKTDREIRELLRKNWLEMIRRQEPVTPTAASAA